MSQDQRTELEVKRDPKLDEKGKNLLWKLYDEAFSRIAEHNPCRQHFHKDEFEDAMQNPKYHLIIGYDGEVPVFFCMLTESFELVPWIAQEFFDAQYPETIGHRIYIPIIFVNIKHQGLHHFRTMMLEIQDYMEARGLTHAYYDHGTEGPTKMLTDMIAATPRTEGSTVGMQAYDVVRTFPEE